MERAVIWAVLGAAILGWLATAITSSAFSGLASPRATATPPTSSASSEASRVLLAFALAALALSVFVFALTLPERGDVAGLGFGAGQGFGRGWLLGGVAALAGAFAGGAFSGRAQEDNFGRALGASAPLWPILAGLALVSLFGRAVLLDAIGGFIGGHVATSLLLASGVSRLNADSAGKTSENSRDFATLLAMGAVFAALLGATVLLGTFRDFHTIGLPVGTWAALTLGTALALAFVPLFGALLQKLAPQKASGNASGLLGGAMRWIAALLLIGVVRALSSKLVDETGAVFAVALGVLAGIVATWCAREAKDTNREIVPAMASPFGALAVLGALLGAFVMMQGVGVGLMLLGFWPAILFALSDDATKSDDATNSATTSVTTTSPEGAATSPALSLQLAPTLVQLGAFGTLMVIYRGVQTHFGADLRGVALSDQYALWGFLSGALTPSLLAGAHARVSWLSQMLRVFLAGAASVALPVLLTVFFGPKCALALLMGLSVGALLRPTLDSGGAICAAWATFIGACLLQWTHRWLPLAELSRAEKTRALGFVVGAAVVLWLLSEFLGRRGPAEAAATNAKATYVA